MSRRREIINLITSVSAASCRCPAHSNTWSNVSFRQSQSGTTKEYAFEMACSTVRFGPGVTKEIGLDAEALGSKNALVVTDKNLVNLRPMRVALDSLTKNKINFTVFDNVRIEPTEESFMTAINFAKAGKFDLYIAVGGGSVMDTCKVANLYSADPEADFLDYVNAPIGKGKPVTAKLAPLIAVTTTSGTGSETTGAAVFDYLPLKAKTGISHRALRPTLGIVDPLHALLMPERVAAYSGFDVLCHALESYTAIPYYERVPCPSHPLLRPTYQGSNPISDVWSLKALRVLAKYFKRSVYNQDDTEARSEMVLASTLAGIGFGNAGVHLCHGMSYPIAGNVKTYIAKEYKVDYPIIPHGLSVVITAPAVFSFTSPMCPERHLEAAQILGYDITNVKKEDAGRVLADVLRRYMSDMKIEDGLSALGFTTEDIPGLVKGTIPQERVTKMSPRSITEDDLTTLFENAMKVY